MTVDPVDGIKWYLVFLFSTCCHEAAHAWSALRLGDDTAHRGGQVTLDPTPHVRREPFGMVVVPLLSFFLGGWMIGWASAPYDPNWALRYPRRAGLMAMAGPAANLILVLLAVLFMRMGFEWGVFKWSSHINFQHIVASTSGGGDAWSAVAQLLSLFFSLNLLLAVFNLLPVPPLDGSSIPLLFLSHESATRYWLALRNPSLAWMGMFFAWKVMGGFFPELFGKVLKLLYMTIGME